MLRHRCFQNWQRDLILSVFEILSSPHSGVLTSLYARGQSSLGSGGENGGFNPLYQIGGPRSIQLALSFNSERRWKGGPHAATSIWNGINRLGLVGPWCDPGLGIEVARQAQSTNKRLTTGTSPIAGSSSRRGTAGDFAQLVAQVAHLKVV